MFVNSALGELVPITGTDPIAGEWTHRGFVPNPLPNCAPELLPSTYLAVANARAALASLDATARRLPNPMLFRRPTLAREAQSTSALEGTYAPLSEVLTADDENPSDQNMIEILNYVTMAEVGFGKQAEGWPLTTGVLCELQGRLMRGTPLDAASGKFRDRQVVIGRRDGVSDRMLAIHAARFVPTPAGILLETGISDLLDWMKTDHNHKIDPVIATAMAHYQFETLHPFRDGNGRLGRFLIVWQLIATGVLSEPTLSVSPWFESRRPEYYDRLLDVSTRNEWDGFVSFFASGLEQSAKTTERDMVALVRVQTELKQLIRNSHLRANTALALVDLAVAYPSFTIKTVEKYLNVSYGRANKLVSQLIDIGVLKSIDPTAYKRRFYSPQVMAVLTTHSSDLPITGTPR